MQKKEYAFTYEVYDSAEELNQQDAMLLAKAQAVTPHAYAPYSHFRVGAAARLQNGEIITGTNQENASFPAGICAERTLLSAAASVFPGIPVEAMAITYFNENGSNKVPISPCGICRQSLLESELRSGMPIRLILGGREGIVYVISRSALLTPFAFTGEDMK